jgi:formylglycine-generating enzyme required for sulfatase activity/serine/threonine protein kinase
MRAGYTCDETLVRRLPLPLAQLYRRATNAKTALEQHLAAYYLWEAGLKLLASSALVGYAALGTQDPQLTERLQNLARPALCHWWEFVRLLVPALTEAGEEGFGPVRDLILGRARDDLPRTADLDAALRAAPAGAADQGAALAGALGGARGARQVVRLSEFFDRLVRYRNQEVGHGAAGQRGARYYELLAPAFLAAVAELLGRLDVLAGRRLVYLAGVHRLASGNWLIERYELVGETARRVESAELPEAAAARLPRPEHLYLEPAPADGPEGAAPGADPAGPGRCLHPLAVYDAEAGEVLFLNARRGQRRTEYLSYTTGRVVARDDAGPEQRDFLGRLLGGPVGDPEVQRWAEQSLQEDPPVEPPAGPPPRRLGDFELLSRLGRGGMGAVYRAWQSSLGRQVALKCLLRPGDAKAEARFEREVHALGRVEHPNLIKIFTSGCEGDQWFYAMELVEGATLAAVCDRLHAMTPSAAGVDLGTWQSALHTVCEESRGAEASLSTSSAIGPAQRRPAAEGPAAPRRPHGHPGRGYVEQVVALVRQVAQAAHALNEGGVVHRDIKPGNILVTADGGQAVLMDLGLAQLADDVEGRLTRTRQFVGTLRYASPEQVLAAGKLDRRADVYSLGATLWELLTLRPMFGATEQMPTPELMQRILTKEPERIRAYHPGIPADLEAVVLKCLEKDPDRRYATARELAEDLERWQAGEPVLAQRPSVRYLIGKYVRRHRLGVTAPAALLALAVAGIIVLAYHVQQTRREAEAEGLTKQILHASLVRAKDLIDQELPRYRRWADPLLEEEAGRDDAPDPDAKARKLRASLALAPRDPSYAAYLAECLLDPSLSWDDFGMLRDALQPGRDVSPGRLWQTLRDARGDAQVRLRAGVALARYDPDPKRWTKGDLSFLAEQILASNPDEQARLRGHVRALRAGLEGPVHVSFRNGSPNFSSVTRVAAARALVDWFGDDPGALADLASQAVMPEQYDIVFARLSKLTARPKARHAAVARLRELCGLSPGAGPASREDAAPFLVGACGAGLAASPFGTGPFPAVTALVAATPEPARPWADKRVLRGQRRAGAVITLLRLDGTPEALKALPDQEDPEALTQFIHGAAPRGVDPGVLTRCLLGGSADDKEGHILYALLSALGEYPRADIPDLGEVTAKVRAWHANDPRPAVHGITGWLLRHWKAQGIPDGEGAGLPLHGTPDGKGWRRLTVGGQAMTLILCPRGTFAMGSPPKEFNRSRSREPRHAVEIERPFAICDREVTWEQFRCCVCDMPAPFRNAREQREGTPVSYVTWDEAVFYCRWLTTKAGLPEAEQCYADPAPPSKGAGLFPQYRYHPERPGFRLPTEAEWEYACRGRTMTTYGFGNDARLLGKYGWFDDNGQDDSGQHVSGTRPGGQLRPNLWGLFDMHGNAWERCQDWYHDYPASDPNARKKGTSNRMVRGGAWYNTARYCRSAYRNDFELPTTRTLGIGFRIVCTVQGQTAAASAGRARVRPGSDGKAAAAP